MADNPIELPIDAYLFIGELVLARDNVPDGWGMVPCMKCARTIAIPWNQTVRGDNLTGSVKGLKHVIACRLCAAELDQKR